MEKQRVFNSMEMIRKTVKDLLLHIEFLETEVRRLNTLDDVASLIERDRARKAREDNEISEEYLRKRVVDVTSSTDNNAS